MDALLIYTSVHNFNYDLIKKAQPSAGFFNFTVMKQSEKLDIILRFLYERKDDNKEYTIEAKLRSCLLSAYCHALCTSDASFLRASVITLTSQLVLARHQAGQKCFAGGKAVAGLCLLFVLALHLASSPRNPRTLARARVVLTLISVVVKFIRP